MFAGPPSPLAWVAIEHPSEFVPLNDIREHAHGMRCWCNPEVDETMTIVHQALDRRDDYMEKRRRVS